MNEAPCLEARDAPCSPSRASQFFAHFPRLHSMTANQDKFAGKRKSCALPPIFSRKVFKAQVKVQAKSQDQQTQTQTQTQLALSKLSKLSKLSSLSNSQPNQDQVVVPLSKPLQLPDGVRFLFQPAKDEFDDDFPKLKELFKDANATSWIFRSLGEIPATDLGVGYYSVSPVPKSGKIHVMGRTKRAKRGEDQEAPWYWCYRHNGKNKATLEAKMECKVYTRSYELTWNPGYLLGLCPLKPNLEPNQPQGTTKLACLVGTVGWTAPWLLVQDCALPKFAEYVNKLFPIPPGVSLLDQYQQWVVKK